MDLLEPYVGKYVSAESASSKLDAAAIMSGCDAVDGEAANITNNVNDLSSKASRLNENALSVDGMTIQGAVSDYCSYLNSIKDNITTSTNGIREAAASAYNMIQQELNDEARARDLDAKNREENGK